MSTRELLPDYLLGLLEPPEKAQVEAELSTSPELRKELSELQEVLFKLPQSLPPVTPPPRVWNKIQTKTSPRRQWWRIGAAAAVLAVLWLGSFGLNQYTANQTLAKEQTKIARWLTQEGAHVETLRDSGGKAFGSVIMLPDERCLFVLNEAPTKGRVYQAWGRKPGQGVAPVSLGVFAGRVFETKYDGFAFVGISSEPPGGSPQPTKPLGRVATS